jgi:hypothetical protein
MSYNKTRETTRESGEAAYKPFHRDSERGAGAPKSFHRKGGHEKKFHFKEQTEEVDPFTKFISKFEKNLKIAGITDQQSIDDLVTRFFGISQTVETLPPLEEEDDDDDGWGNTKDVADDSVFASQMAGVAAQKQPESASEPAIGSDLITKAAMIIVCMVQRQLFVKNEIDNVPPEYVEDLTKYYTDITNSVPCFKFPANANIHPDFIKNMMSLDVLPQLINMKVDAFTKMFTIHVETVAYLDRNIKIKSDAIKGADPKSHQLVINQGRVISFSEEDSKKYHIAFMSASSDVALGQFPKDIRFLPKFMHNLLKKLPTIGDCFLAVQDSQKTDSLVKWLETDIGDYLTGGQINPTSGYLGHVMLVTSSILEAVHNTAINRNSRSESHCIMSERRKAIFPVVFTKYHLTLGKIFNENADEFFSIARGIKDFRYINISIEMGMIASLIMIGNGTENLQNLENALTDYYKNISRRGDETVDEKKQRIYVANSALMNVVKFLYQILCFEACKKALTEDEYALLSDWLFNARELFPRNISDKKTRHRDSRQQNYAEDTSAHKQEEYDEMFPPAKPITTPSTDATEPKKPVKAWKAPGRSETA